MAGVNSLRCGGKGGRANNRADFFTETNPAVQQDRNDGKQKEKSKKPIDGSTMNGDASQSLSD